MAIASVNSADSFNQTNETSESLLFSEEKEDVFQTRFNELKEDGILFLKCFSVLIGTWIIGFLNMSFSYLVIGILVFISYRRIYELNKKSLSDKITVARDAKTAILTNLKDLPKWVFFPDVEKADWINTILEQLWPSIVQYVNVYLRDSVIPDIDGILPSYLQPFIFTEMDLGDIPPRVGGVKVYSKKNVRRGMVMLDVEISYTSDAVISVRLNKIKGGIKSFSLRGTLRVVLSPLIPQIPFAGAASVCFLTNPELEFNLTDFGNLLELPGIRHMMFNLIRELIASMIVLPERMIFPFVENIDLGKLKHPLPDGVLRIHVKAAKELVKADFGVFGGTSDPYVEIRVGSQKFKTKTIKKNINPTWNEYFDAVVDQKSGQKLEFIVYDEDPGKDDFIGCGNIDIEVVYKKAVLDTWIQLEQVKSGSIHFELEWMDLANDPLAVHATVGSFKELHSKEVPVNSAYLSVFVDSAHNLHSKRSIDEPFPFVTVAMDNKEFNTEAKERTRDPVWEQHFQFLVFNPEIAELRLTIKNKAKNNAEIGSRNIPLKNLLQEPDMVAERGYTLKGADPNTLLYLRLVLRALIPGRIRNHYDENYTRKSIMSRRDTINEARKSFYNRTGSLLEMRKASFIKTEKEAEDDRSNLPNDDTKSDKQLITRSISFREKFPDNDSISANVQEEPSTNNDDENVSVEKKTFMRKCMPKKKKKSSKNNHAAVDSDDSDESETAVEVQQLSPSPSSRFAHSPITGLRSSSRTPSGNVASPSFQRENGPSVDSEARIQLTFRYSSVRECLIIVVHQIVNLSPYNEDGLADPFVKLTLLSKDIINTKKKTSHKKSTLNPLYDETLEFHLNHNHISHSMLRIEVINHSNRASFSKHKRVINVLEVPLLEYTKTQSITEWFSFSSSKRAIMKSCDAV